jgi:hypothetical protein
VPGKWPGLFRPSACEGALLADRPPISPRVSLAPPKPALPFFYIHLHKLQQLLLTSLSCALDPIVPKFPRASLDDIGAHCPVRSIATPSSLSAGQSSLHVIDPFSCAKTNNHPRLSFCATKQDT